MQSTESSHIAAS